MLRGNSEWKSERIKFEHEVMLVGEDKGEKCDLTLWYLAPEENSSSMKEGQWMVPVRPPYPSRISEEDPRLAAAMRKEKAKKAGKGDVMVAGPGGVVDDIKDWQYICPHFLK